MQRVFVDFGNADVEGRVRLNTAGTIDDLCDQGIELVEGLELTLYQEYVEMKAVVTYSLEEQMWVAKVDWFDRYKDSVVIP
jgi:hypothetical protein